MAASASGSISAASTLAAPASARGDGGDAAAGGEIQHPAAGDQRRDGPACGAPAPGRPARRRPRTAARCRSRASHASVACQIGVISVARCSAISGTSGGASDDGVGADERRPGRVTAGRAGSPAPTASPTSRLAWNRRRHSAGIVDVEPPAPAAPAAPPAAAVPTEEPADSPASAAGQRQQRHRRRRSRRPRKARLLRRTAAPWSARRSARRPRGPGGRRSCRSRDPAGSRPQ